jgi:hypothetical protein
MNQYRVTKYDPALRNASGAYPGGEWTSFGDVGTSVSSTDYERLESAYIEAATAFLDESGVTQLAVRGLEHSGRPVSVTEGLFLSPPEWAVEFRAVLRDEYWCRFEAPNGFVHFGHDFYMYVGVHGVCERAIELAGELGLYVEPFVSPYEREHDAPPTR